MTVFDDLQQANQDYAARFSLGDLPPQPEKRLVVITCMDTRIDPLALLGLDVGEAHVLRNAGGRVTEDVLRSLLVSSYVLGTRSYAVIHHTECGMLGFDPGTIRRLVGEERGEDVDGIDFGGFSDLEASVREDIRVLLESAVLPLDIDVRGYVYDVRTGRLKPVESGPIATDSLLR